ncbi:hypothetical protein T4D_14367 [Trichinella pseudospiralis]|uniref:FLYWCH-type domain-containing protein n=1 Tax=Trichinella pseudospiralis TaxID=6337 RepID=A0A0V1FEN2_TRIPS|nr:hypothetical protein T4D_14367 [Trichinella pseudospiralis]
MSLVYEGRAYKLKCAGLEYFGIRQKRLRWFHMDKPCCNISDQAECSHRELSETKPIPAIYDEEASATSAVPLTFRHFPPFKLVKSTMYSHQSKQYPDHITSEPI